jgi:hypothetical protein
MDLTQKGIPRVRRFLIRRHPPESLDRSPERIPVMGMRAIVKDNMFFLPLKFCDIVPHLRVS